MRRGRRRRAAGSHPGDHRSRTVSAPAASPAAESSRPARAPGSSAVWTAFVVAVMVAFAVLTAVTVVQRHQDYRTYRNDMGNMVQVVDNTAHGRILQMTSGDGRQISRLASHVDPILALFALPWLVWPDPAMLLVAQAVLVALAAWPVFLLGRRALGDTAAAALCAAAALLYPPLQFAALDEFHPVTLVIPLLLFAFVFLEEDRRWLAVPFLVLAALCKEEIPLVIALMGLYFALRKRTLWPLLITVAAGLYFLLAVGVVIPHFNGGSSSHFLGRYSGGEESMRSLATGLLTHPWRAVTTLLAPSGLAYLVKLLWPFGFTSLASPLTFLISLPELLINLLSGKSQQHSIAYHYVAAEAPFVIAAMVLGLRRISGWLAEVSRKTRRGGPRRLARVLAGAVVAVALVATLTAGPLSGARPGWGLALTPEHRAVVSEALGKVPPDASVSADNALAAQLSERERITTFPVIGGVEYVVLDSQGRYGPWRAKALKKLRADPAYELVFLREGVLVFRRVGGASAPASGG
jgi:uncharacterized membrane protein